MNVQTTPAATALGPFKSRLQEDRSFATSKTDNTIPIEAWNTVLFEKFCRFRHSMSLGLAGHSDELFRRNSFPAGARVLDIGFGFGDTTPAHRGTGSPQRQGRGCRLCKKFHGLGNTRSCRSRTKQRFVFERRCARRRSSGSLRLRVLAIRHDVFICRDLREDNSWVHEAERRVKQIVPVVPHEETDQVHCGPGPFSMSGPGMVSDMRGAQATSTSLLPATTPTFALAVTWTKRSSLPLALGPAGEIIRLAGETGERLRGQVIAALRETLSPYKRSDGIWAASSTWFVTARNPAR